MSGFFFWYEFGRLHDTWSRLHDTWSKHRLRCTQFYFQMFIFRYFNEKDKKIHLKRR